MDGRGWNENAAGRGYNNINSCKEKIIVLGWVSAIIFEKRVWVGGKRGAIHL